MTIIKFKIALILAFSLLTFACNSSTSDANAKTNGIPPNSAGDITNPCKVLTPAQIQAAVGIAIIENKSDTLGDLYSCYYGANYTQADGVPNLSITIRTDKSLIADGTHATAADYYHHFHDAVVAGKTKTVSPSQYFTHLDGATDTALVEDVSGLGSAAFYYYADQAYIQLWILKGSVETTFLIHLPASAAGSEKDRLKTVAGQFLAAVP